MDGQPLVPDELAESEGLDVSPTASEEPSMSPVESDGSHVPERSNVSPTASEEPPVSSVESDGSHVWDESHAPE